MDVITTGSYSPIEVKLLSQKSKLSPKVNRLLLSCILSSAIFLISLTLGLAAAAGLFHDQSSLFWLPITFGSLGVSGSTYISIRRLWIGQRTS